MKSNTRTIPLQPNKKPATNPFLTTQDFGMHPMDLRHQAAPHLTNGNMQRVHFCDVVCITTSLNIILPDPTGETMPVISMMCIPRRHKTSGQLVLAGS